MLIALPVWYKTRFDSKNFGYQIWWVFYIYIYNALKNMFDMSNNVIKYRGSVITHDWYIRF